MVGGSRSKRGGEMENKLRSAVFFAVSKKFAARHSHGWQYFLVVQWSIFLVGDIICTISTALNGGICLIFCCLNMVIGVGDVRERERYG